MSLTLRNEKGSKLTHSELDENFLFLLRLIEGIQIPEAPVSSSDLSWNEVDLVPGTPVSVVGNGSWINLNLNVNSDLWTTPVKFSGLAALPNSLVDGAFGTIKNSSKLPVNLIHLSSENRIPFNLSTSEDFVLQANSAVQMVYSSKNGMFNVLANSAVRSDLKTPKSEVFRISQEHLDSENVVLELKELPSENEFIFTFCNGVLLNPNGIRISDRFLVIDKKTIEYEFRVGMKITVNYKH